MNILFKSISTLLLLFFSSSLFAYKTITLTQKDISSLREGNHRELIRLNDEHEIPSGIYQVESIEEGEDQITGMDLWSIKINFQADETSPSDIFSPEYFFDIIIAFRKDMHKLQNN